MRFGLWRIRRAPIHAECCRSRRLQIGKSRQCSDRCRNSYGIHQRRDDTEAQQRVLDSKEMRTLVAFHGFREGEAIHFYRNVLVLYARNDDVTVELVSMVSAVANVVPISTPSQPT